MTKHTQPKVILREVFGFNSFRDQQEEIIATALAQKDSLVIMPTGGGKSLCYQIPALVQNGLTLVISPLIALMADQVQALKANNVEAAFVNSSQTAQEKRVVFEKIESGQLKLLYISPEKALAPNFLTYISRKSIELLAIDEAHCVSIWGNDFRPEYARLKQLISKLPHTPVMALTATADKATQKDIVAQLGLRQPKCFISSFERKNIGVEVRPGQGRLKQVISFLHNHRDEAGIIYCLSRKSTEELSMKLRSAGFNATHFHAEISAADKRRIQYDFQRDDVQIVCATIAFGMGIDKSNIRWIIHYNMPKNIESYYQEIGRAGRDGASADALLFYSYRDISVFKQFIDQGDGNATFKMVQHAKLDRMWEMTQASNCRTNLVLNYFGEFRAEECGHCDNCLHPPEGFDGTELATKAVKACKQAEQKIGMHLLIDVLRASGKKEIFYQGLDKLESYGSGRDLPRLDWQGIITQLVNQGILEIDYTQKSTLKLTQLSHDLLQGKLNIILTRQQSTKSRSTSATLSKGDQFKADYLRMLKDLRKSLASREDVPAYMIFSDKVLEAIYDCKPIAVDDLLEVPGIGAFKWRKYGRLIIEEIQTYLMTQTHKKQVKGKSKLESLQLWREGLTPEEIAAEKQLQPSTIYAHLADLYERGEAIDLKQYLSDQEFQMIEDAWRKSNYSDKLNDISSFLQEQVSLYKIRLALALLRPNQSRHNAGASIIPLNEGDRAANVI